MKHTFSKSYLIIIIASMLVSSCVKDLCDSKQCENGGTCIDGRCNCLDGYEGENCEVQSGYDCNNGTCVFVTYSYISPDYKSYYLCQTSCANKQSGYDCVNGTCITTTYLPEYNSLSLCKNSCSSSNDCFSTPYYGQQNCNSSENVRISPTACCKKIFPYFGVQTDLCYSSCLAAKNAGNSSIVYGTGETSSNNFGYNCINGNCVTTTYLPDYSSLTICQNACNSNNDCFSSPYSGEQNCNSGFVAVSSSSCCPIGYRYLGSEKGKCYATCLAAKIDGNSTIVYGTGNTSGGNTSGKAIFYTLRDHKCGTITVVLAGFSQNITSYYSTTPNCDASGCATFSLQPGSYTYTAKCNGFSWPVSTVVITSGGCSKYNLN